MPAVQLTRTFLGVGCVRFYALEKPWLRPTHVWVCTDLVGVPQVSLTLRRQTWPEYGKRFELGATAIQFLCVFDT